MNKFKIIFPLLVGVSCLASCNNDQIKRYTVKLFDYTASSNYTEYAESNSIRVKEGDTFEYPSKPSRKTFYKFIGWTSDEEHKEFYDFNAPVTSDVTLYATYAKADERIIYLDYDDGIERWAIRKIGSEVDVSKFPTEPYEEKWKFNSWYLNKALTMKLSNTTFTIGEDDVYLYAEYIKKIFPVKFYPNDGVIEWAMTQNIDWGEKATYYVPKTKTGKTFIGWYTDPEGGDLFDFETPIYQKYILYGHWKDPVVM